MDNDTETKEADGGVDVEGSSQGTMSSSQIGNDQIGEGGMIVEDLNREMTDDDVIVEAKNLTVRFDSDRGVSRVLDNVSMNIYRNEVLGVIGESGSGKSMFADSILNAVVEPGEVTGEVIYHREDGETMDVLSLEGNDLRKFRWVEMATVFQGAQDAFNPTTKIETHFKETLQAHDVDEKRGMERARELLEDVYLQPDRVLDSYAHELSGGMKQRTLIALSLLLEPDILIMDEPTAALDLLMQRSIITLLNDLQEKYNLTLIFITHDLPLVEDIADRLAVMYAFDIVEVGTSKQLINNASHPYTRKLLNSTPNLEMPIDGMEPIEGNAPDPVNIPRGCSFAARCPLATDECSESQPPFERVESGHFTACYHWQEAAEEIPAITEMVPEVETDE